MSWLLADQSTSLGDFEPTPELDARLTALARRAKHDRSARDALYGALRFKIDRFARRYRARRHWWLVICDEEDVAQEAFIVFCELIERWPGRESFLGYFFSRFPWRLARAVDRIERGQNVTQLVPLDDREVPRTIDPMDQVFLAEISAGFTPRERAVLELRVGRDLRFSEIARALGVTERTVFRDWARIVAALRERRFD